MIGDEKRSAIIKMLEDAHRVLHPWGVLVGTGCLLLFFVITHVLHLAHDEIAVNAALIGLVFLLGEQVRGLARLHHITIERQEKIHSDNSRALDKLQAELVGHELLSLTDCVSRIKARISRLAANERVVIHHLGLSMGTAWEQVDAMLLHLNVKMTIEYHLLMMDGNGTPGENDTISGWRAEAIKMRGFIQARSGVLRDQLNARGINLDFSVKTYQAIPFVHGIKIVAPASSCVTYLAFCRWTDERFNYFEWGQHHFHEIVGESLSPDSRDICNVFDGFFGHHSALQTAEATATPTS